MSIPWFFYVIYDHALQKLNLYPRKQENDYELPEETIGEASLLSVIHRYDYKKLDFFSQMKKETFFMTILRFHQPSTKKYLKTHALCYATKQGFYGFLVLDYEIFMLKKHETEDSSEELLNDEFMNKFIKKDHIEHLNEQFKQLLLKDLMNT